ncbi:WhiB family transcriptional regulator [Streptosporangium sp. NPDC051023]|uniref:WhiB family transcriptional regulator n=1 Tax=Streptosporangium sp. NPDC051023 TaxID=3155410 RepID=UPI00344DEE04
MTTPLLSVPVAHPALVLVRRIIAGLSPLLAEGALCGTDPELHTGPDAFTAESAEEQAAREQVAREVCEECPVRALCLNRALRLRPGSGVWAGLTATEIGQMADLLPPARLIADQPGKSNESEAA